MMNRVKVIIALLVTTLPLSAVEIRAVIDPKEKTTFTSEVNSTVKAINRKLGETFDEGDPLILLDDVVYLANLMKARAEVAKAEADFEGAKKLWADKVISHTDYRTAEAAVATAQSDLALALKAFNACLIKAPYRGKVVTVFVKLYEHVEPNQPLIEILGDSVLIAKLLIPEIYLKDFKIGDMITLKIKETTDTVQAKIVRIGAVIDPVSELFKLEAEIDNSNDQLRSGMEGKLILPDKEVSK